MSTKYFWFKFIPSDWRKDPDLSRCSRAAKGFWIDAICILYETEEPGVFKTNGIPWPDREIVAAIGGDYEEGLACLTELLSKGVASRSKDGAVFARRIVRDHQKRMKCVEAGKAGGNPSLKRTLKGDVKGEVKGEVKHPSNSNFVRVESTVLTEVPKFTLVPLQTEPSERVSALESSVLSIAQRMYDRHPPVRRCSITVIQKQLRAIVRKISSVPLKIAKLEQVDKSHDEWCACSDWTKDDGQYAKGLDNWLAPSLARWEVPPADAGVLRSQQSTMLSMEEQDRLVREHSERLYGS